jgi:uncharacterized protein YbjT (DUF2867 family)
MKVLLAGVNSYIGKRLIPFLAEKGHEVVCIVRDKKTASAQSTYGAQVSFINGDMLRSQSIDPFPADIDAACYLINNLTQTSGFAGLEALAAQNFIDELNKTGCRHIVTLSGIQHQMTPAVYSRKHVEELLLRGKAELTILHTAMIIGHESMALELLGTVADKDTIILAKSWLKAYCQPIYADDVLGYIEGCLLNEKTFGRKFDIGGPEVLSFRQMVLNYIAVSKRNKPHIITVPLLTPSMSSYLLNILSPLSYTMAKSIVDNLQYDNICRDHAIKTIIPRQCVNFKRSLRLLSNDIAPVYH